MQIRSKRNKLIITALDKEGMALLIGGEYERVCALCAAAYDEKSRELLDELVNERLPTDVVEGVEQAIQGKECTFSAFVIAAVRAALEDLKDDDSI